MTLHIVISSIRISGLEDEETSLFLLRHFRLIMRCITAEMCCVVSGQCPPQQFIAAQSWSLFTRHTIVPQAAHFTRLLSPQSARVKVTLCASLSVMCHHSHVRDSRAQITPGCGPGPLCEHETLQRAMILVTSE